MDSGFQAAVITASAGSANSILIGNSGNDIINADNANDILISRSAVGDSTTINAANGNALIFGGAGNDIINAGGSGGQDIVFAGSGNDTINLGAASALVYAEAGNDKVNYTASISGAAPQIVDGGKGYDVLNINLTSAQYALPAVQNALHSFEAFLTANANSLTDVGPQFSFGNYTPSMNLTVANFEGLNVYVNGVLAVNLSTAPVAVADSYSTTEDASLSIAAAGVLANDINPQHNPLAAVLDSGPTHGSLGTGGLNANGSFTYTPNPEFVGTDSFTYQATDGVVLTSPVTVTITVTDNDAPLAPMSPVQLPAVQEDSTMNTIASSVLLNGTTSSGAALLDQPLSVYLANGAQSIATTHGMVSLNMDGSLNYQPTMGYMGPDNFSYQVIDADGVISSNFATADITVNPLGPVMSVFDKDIGEYTFLAHPLTGPITETLLGGMVSQVTDIGGNSLDNEGTQSVVGATSFTFANTVFTSVDLTTPTATANDQIVIGQTIDSGGFSLVALMGEGSGSTLIADPGSSDVRLVPGPTFSGPGGGSVLLDNGSLGSVAIFDHNLAHFSLMPAAFSIGSSSYTGYTVTDTVLGAYNEGTDLLGVIAPNPFDMSLTFDGSHFTNIQDLSIVGSPSNGDLLGITNTANELLFSQASSSAPSSFLFTNSGFDFGALVGNFAVSGNILQTLSADTTLVPGPAGGNAVEGNSGLTAIVDYAQVLANYAIYPNPPSLNIQEQEYTQQQLVYNFGGVNGASKAPDFLVNMEHFNFDGTKFDGGLLYNPIVGIGATADNQILDITTPQFYPSLGPGFGNGEFLISGASLVGAYHNETITAAAVNPGYQLVLDATGVAGPVYLIGNSGNNILIGNGQSDVLNGNGGNATLVGAPGTDTFQFTSVHSLGPVTTINNFELGIDKLEFRAPYLTAASVSNSAELLDVQNLAAGSLSPPSNPHNAAFIFDQTSNNLWYDTHTAQGMVDIIHMNNIQSSIAHPHLTAADIVVL